MILLTGGTGYIGSHTAVELINQNYDVVLADDCSNSSREVLERLKTITGKAISFYEINVADKRALSSVFENHAIDVVIHFAACKAVNESVFKPLKYYRNNISALLSVLEVMADYDVSKIVFSSSAAVYGATDQLPLKENAALRALNPYSRTKIINEDMLRDVAFIEERFSAVILRYFNPVGAHESGLIGEDPNSIPNNLMPYISQVAIGKLPFLNIYGSDYPTKDGTGVRDYIHVVDLAKGHVDAVEYAFKHTGTEIFNLGTGQPSSVLDMVKTFEQENQINVPYKIVGRREGDAAVSYADPAKANEVLHWQAAKTLEDMCRDTWQWQKMNPDGYGGRRR